VLLGLAFPIGLSVWLGDTFASASRVARRTGAFYSLNLAGAIAGSLGAGFILLPEYGSRGTLIGLAAVSLLCALALVWWSSAPRLSRLAVAIGCVAAAAPVAAAVPDPFGEYLRQRFPDERVIWRREAVQATVSVHERPDGTLTLNVNGNHQASSAGTMPFVHRRIGNLPMAVHPDPRRALVIGLGGGATAGAVSQHPGVSVDVVELSREVVVAADRFFRPINASLLQQPHVRVTVDDGRNYLLLTEAKYDVITADVILPIHAGAGNLYSAEYFSLVRRALKPGGIAIQWVAGTEAEYKLIVRTFLSVFPETTLWADGSLLVGALEPLRLRPRDLAWKLQAPGRREMLAEIGITSFEKLTSLYRAGPGELRQYVGQGPVLTDDRPIVEYFLSLPRDREVDLSGVVGDVSRYVGR
jgi:spermidine synthase